MYRAEIMLKCSLTNDLIWTTTLWLFVESTWTPEFLNARTVRDGSIQPLHTIFKGLNAYDVIGLTNWNTIINLYGAVKLMQKWILHNWKQSRVNYVPILSSAQTARKIIKQTLMSTHSRDTNSTAIGIAKNNKSCMRTGVNQFTQSWAVHHYDL